MILFQPVDRKRSVMITVSTRRELSLPVDDTMEELKQLTPHSTLVCVGSRRMKKADREMAFWIGKKLAKLYIQVIGRATPKGDRAFMRGVNSVNAHLYLCCQPTKDLRKAVLHQDNFTWTARQGLQPMDVDARILGDFDDHSEFQQLLRISYAMLVRFPQVVLAWPSGPDDLETRWIMKLAQKLGKDVMDLSKEDMLEKLVRILQQRKYLGHG